MFDSQNLKNMSQILLLLEVTDNKLPLLLNVLNSLDYVTIVSDEETGVNPLIEVEETSYTEADYLYGFGIMKDKTNFTLENIRKKA